MSSARKESTIIVAGGKGLRAGGDLPKQFRLIGEMPMLMHTILAFHRYNPQMKIVLVLPDGFQSLWNELCRLHDFNVSHKVVMGGETRFHSVKNGLVEIAEEEIVGVHDAARPFVGTDLIARCFNTSERHDCGVIPVVEEVNSVRLLTENGSRIIDRQLLRVIQTPQVFPARQLKKAYEAVFDPVFTDDASVVEKSGMHILMIKGEESNIKITTPFDWIIAETLWQNYIKTTK
ncbi:MAG TPA: 2-C-methyl-D-erythritol 4-phosphate cytidylyltransferase [Porphyromonadaceae bacterium]|jgi:2-C-methyl-D-erythritol 4-phosphate cytidylyltransferase|nr:2-C-methyl-D-erythritol 4-phosphate cytidylyltransferase [Porphyromonadaceae bacterium]